MWCFSSLWTVHFVSLITLMSYFTVCAKNIFHLNDAYSLIHLRKIWRQYYSTTAIRNHPFPQDIQWTWRSIVWTCRYAINYSKYNYNIHVGLKVNGMLMRIQSGFTKYYWFLSFGDRKALHAIEITPTSIMSLVFLTSSVSH